MKYPKKYKGEKTNLIFPVLITVGLEELFIRKKDKLHIGLKVGRWYSFSLSKNGDIEKSGTAYYEEEQHCWRPCLAHNNRVGYKNKDVKKIIKKLYNVEEKRKKQKSKKKKGKKNKS